MRRWPGDRTVAQVARDFDLTETAVRAWVRRAEIDAGERNGLTSGERRATSDEREELARLRRENRRLQANTRSPPSAAPPTPPERAPSGCRS